MAEHDQEALAKPAELPWQDDFLEGLVASINVTKLEASITLQFHGMIVCGMLIAGDTYFEGFADELAAAYPEDGRETIRQAIRDRGLRYKVLDPEKEYTPTSFIHLRNTQFYTADGRPYPALMKFWRGRISEVSGFSLGMIGPKS